MKRWHLVSQYDCGCEVRQIENDKYLTDSYAIEYCPKHKAAPDMYEALKGMVIFQHSIPADSTCQAARNRIIAMNKALAKAENKQAEGKQ